MRTQTSISKGGMTIVFYAALAFLTLSFKPVIQPDSRLYNVYSSEFIENLIEKNPNVIEFLNYQLDNSYFEIDLDGKTFPSEYINISTLSYKSKINEENKTSSAFEDFNSGSFNCLKYEIVTFNDHRSFIHIDGTNKFLVFYSNQELKERYNKQRTN